MAQAVLAGDLAQPMDPEAQRQAQIERRRRRGAEELTRVVNRGRHPLYSIFQTTSRSGQTYEVRIRSLEELTNSCSCPDYRANLIGTCKHIEGVLLHLRAQHGEALAALAADLPTSTQVYLHRAEALTVRLAPGLPRAGGPRQFLARYFDSEGLLQGPPLQRLPALLHELEALPARQRAAIEMDPALADHLALLQEREAIARQKAWFLEQVQEGRRSNKLLAVPLFPYQEEGMRHLAFGRRALLADDMGLGKTITAIAAAVLLKELRDIQRVLVVCPASLKHQWAREISRFTGLSVQIIGGRFLERRAQYARPAFFNLINYELVVRDGAELAALRPDVVVLDEAGRIKNWRAKTADAVKRLASPYAFVLTGTPLENRLDELYSLFQFLDPRILGPLWRFNERFYQLEQTPRGAVKVVGYQNLDQLRAEIAPYILRRTRDQVLRDLPERTDNHFFVELSPEQRQAYDGYESTVASLIAKAHRRPLLPKEHQVLLGALIKMRVICNALALHDPALDEKLRERTAPKLRELAEILSDGVLQQGRKAILFSQWTGMLALTAPLLDRLGIGHVTLSGDVPTARRGAVIARFLEDEGCQVLLSTDAGGTGLNLQAASLIVNLDLPWNPAVLEQRIARAHRHGQSRSVQVINLVAQGTIEERLLDSLAAKRNVFQGVFGSEEAPEAIHFHDIGGSLLQTLDEMLSDSPPPAPELALAPAAAGAEAERGDEGSAGSAASGAPRPKPSTFAELAVARFPGRVLLVRATGTAERGGAASNDAGDPAGLLLVVDAEPAMLRGPMEALAAELWPAGAPSLHLMEREGYRALAALLSEGLGDGAGANEAAGWSADAASATAPDSGSTSGSRSAADAPARAESRGDLYRSPSLPRPPGPSSRERRLGAARQSVAAAERQLRLAEHLVSGGFGEEAAAPLREALEGAVTALFRLHAPDAPARTHAPTGEAVSRSGENATSIHPGLGGPDLRPGARAIHSALVAPGHLTAELAARLALARGLLAPPEHDDAAGSLSAETAAAPAATARELIDLALAGLAAGGLRGDGA